MSMLKKQMFQYFDVSGNVEWLVGFIKIRYNVAYVGFLPIAVI